MNHPRISQIDADFSTSSFGLRIVDPRVLSSRFLVDAAMRGSLGPSPRRFLRPHHASSARSSASPQSVPATQPRLANARLDDSPRSAARQRVESDAEVGAGRALPNRHVEFRPRGVRATRCEKSALLQMKRNFRGANGLAVETSRPLGASASRLFKSGVAPSLSSNHFSDPPARILHVESLRCPPP